MPAIDLCEPQVVRALEKDGWIVTHQPFGISLITADERNYIYADLRLNHAANQNTIIVTEVKCFANPRRLLDDFYQAVGQYVVYRNALILNNLTVPLYLAIPSDVYAGFFQRPLIQASIQDVGIKLVIIDMEGEEIVSWIN